MTISFARVEDRLIHGQVTVAWAKVINFNTIVIVDDLIASNKMLIDLQELVCPQGKKLLVLNEEIAKQQLDLLPYQVFLLVKSPITILSLIRSGVKIPKLNFGSIFFNSKKKEVYKNIYLSEDEIQACKEILSRGVICEIQKLPTDSVKNLSDFI